MRLLAFALIPALVALSQTGPASGERYPRLAIRDATVIDGNGTPADILIESSRIAAIAGLDPVALNAGARRLRADLEIEANGEHVLPGLIDARAHIQDFCDNILQPLESELKTWLACGITSVPDICSNFAQSPRLRAGVEGTIKDGIPYHAAAPAPEAARFG
jgi:hypothetical protein